jgi:uncharacterized protein
MLRAETEGFVKINVGIDKEEAIDFIENAIIKSNNETSEQISLAIKDSYKRLLEPAISNETLQEAKEKADKKAIEIFSENLTQLLLAPPLGEKEFWPLIRDIKAAAKWCVWMKKEIFSIMKPFILTLPRMKAEWP